MSSKIKNDIKELMEAQVISQDIALKIETYYKQKSVDKPNILFTVFGVLGALLVGSGIILIMAHNWDDFSRTIKTVFAFLPLVIGQLLVGYSILKNKSATWKESSGVFLFFAIGSSIALVSQIYNIPGELSSFLLTWILLALPLVYLLKSNVLGILNIIFITYYGCADGYFFRAVGASWICIALLLAMMPYYGMLLKYKVNRNITSLFNWLIPLSLIIVLGTFIKTYDALIYLMYMLLFGLFYNLGSLPYFNEKKLRQNGFLVLGSLGTIYLLFWASFDFIWDSSFSYEDMGFYQELNISIVLFLSTLGVLVYSYIKKWLLRFNLFQYVFIIYVILFLANVYNNTIFGVSYYAIIPIVLVNLLILALGVVAMKIGIAKYHFGILNYGLAIISILITCRFFDTDISFVLRGILFVVIGCGFFFVNYIMLKKQKKLKT